MADEDIREVYLIPTEWQSDCLVCSDNAGTLVDMLHSGTVKLCLTHLTETQQRADAVEGAHLSIVEDRR